MVGVKSGTIFTPINCFSIEKSLMLLSWYMKNKRLVNIEHYIKSAHIRSLSGPNVGKCGLEELQRHILCSGNCLSKVFVKNV